MSQNKQSGTEPSGSSSSLLQLKAHKIVLLDEQLGIISNEIQAFGAILEALGAAITLYGNKIGANGFRLETMATRLHIASVLQELRGEDNEPEPNLLIQLRAYNMLLTANIMGVASNEIQAFGAAIQTAAGIIVAYGNLITVEAFELETMATRLQIAAVLEDLENERRNKSFQASKENMPNTPQLAGNKPGFRLEQLYLKMEQMQDIIDRQQAQIQEIQKELKQNKGIQ
jgi:hypothetical protein